MKIIGRNKIHEARSPKRVFLSMWEVGFEHNGKPGKFFSVARGDSYPEYKDKKPDAVVIVATLENPGEPKRLVLTSEFRVPIGTREISFPAGLIDPADYGSNAGDVYAAAKVAAVREMKEETGLTFTPTTISPPNLYSSAGMTNESIIIVHGTAVGTPSKEHCEETEDIDVMLLDQAGIERILQYSELPFSKVAWPYIWAFGTKGL